MNIIEMTKAEFLKRGEELFGSDYDKWEFVCPSCGHVQTIGDFRQYKDKGATPESAAFNCIGRYDGLHGAVPMLSGKSPCNYTTGGLFNISPFRITDEEDRVYSRFAFNEVPS